MAGSQADHDEAESLCLSICDRRGRDRRSAGIPLVLGGEGAWPDEDGPGWLRLREFRSFRRALDQTRV